MGIKIQAGYNFIGGTKFFDPPVAPPTYLRSIDALGIDQQIGKGISIHSDYIFVSNGRSTNNGELWIYDRSVPDAAPIVFNPPQHGGADWGDNHLYIESQKLLIVSNGYAELHNSSNSGGLVQFFDLTDINNIVTLREYGGTGINQYIGATMAVGGGKLWTSKYTGAFGEENVLYSFDLDDIQAGPVKYDKPSHVVDHRDYWGAHLDADDDYLYVFDQMGDMYTYIYNVSDFSYVTKVSDPIQSINYRPCIAGDFWLTVRYSNAAVAIYEKGTGNLVKMIGQNIDGETTFKYYNNGARMYGKYLGLFNVGEPSADNNVWRISFYDTTNWDADPVHLETTSSRGNGKALGEDGSSAIALDPVNNELWWGAGNFRGESSVMIFDASSLMPAPAAAPSSSYDWSSASLSLTLSHPYNGGSADFGRAVSTSGDYHVVSQPTAHRVVVFDASGNVVRTIGHPEGSTDGSFGEFVHLKGNNLLVGDKTGEESGQAAWLNSGRAWLFDVTTGSVLHSFLPSPAEHNGMFGQFMALSENYVAITHGINNNNYKVNVYDISTGLLVRVITPETTETNQYWGSAIGISDSYIAISATNRNSGSGVVEIFDISSGQFLRTIDNPNTFGTNENDRFGNSVSLSGNYLAVGAYEEDSSSANTTGAAYVFDVTDGSLLHTLTSDTPAHHFGKSVSISGTYLAVGDYITSSYQGVVYVYDVTDGSLVYTASNPTPANYDFMGMTVSLSGGKLIASAKSNPAEAHVWEAPSS